jgi:hypothetical protein
MPLDINTQIHPHISEIKQVVEYKNYIRILEAGDKVEKTPKYIFEPKVKIQATLQDKHQRALSDSVQLSDRLGMIVTRANPKKGAKTI